MILNNKNNIQRCHWAGDNELMIQYHDKEWGVPVNDDLKWFEFLVLESFQAGLSWRTILHKRENFRKAFLDFNPEKIARFSEKDIEKLLQNPGIVRNKLKIKAAINNANRFLEIQKELGSFNYFIRKFLNDKVIDTHRKPDQPSLANSPESDALSKELKNRGFKFVGTTICYALMQATGLINDHHTACFRYKELKNMINN